MTDDEPTTGDHDRHDSPTPDCYSCRCTADPDLPPRERIVRTPRWRVVHAFGTSLPGWLVVVPERHVTAIAELTAAEAAELGELLRTLSIALQETVGCVKTYVMQFSEAEGFAHLHFHVVPRAADIPDDLKGPHVFGYHRGDPADHVSEADRDDLSRRIGAVLGRLAAGDAGDVRAASVRKCLPHRAFTGQVQARPETVPASTNATSVSGQEWRALSPDYERARSRVDSLDRLVEWPAQRALLGDVTGLSVLDLGCGNGSKLAELVDAGATTGVGVDVGGNFLAAPPEGLELVEGDLNELESLPALAGRSFDRILFLQSFGYSDDPVRTLRTARSMLTDDGFILLTRTQPIRYAVERAEQNGTTLGEEYFSASAYTYRTRWSDTIALTKRTYTISDLLNTFSAAGLWVETTIEPQLSEEARRRYPHKQEWMNTYLGILVFRLRPLPG